MNQGSPGGVTREAPRPEAKFNHDPRPPPHAEPTSSTRIAFQVRLPAPALVYPSIDGSQKETISPGGDANDHSQAVLVSLWSRTCAPCLRELEAMSRRASEIDAAGVEILALSVDEWETSTGFDAKKAQRVLQKIGFPHRSGRATQALLSAFQERLDHLTPLRGALPLPSSFLIDAQGRLAVLYKGALTVDQLLKDAVALPQQIESAEFSGTSLALDHPALEAKRVRRALETLFRFANHLRALGQIDVAAEQFREVLRQQPAYAKAHNNLAMILRRQGDLESARRHYERALQSAPDSAEIHNNLGVVYFAQRKWEAARRHYEEARRLKPDYAEAEMNLGVLAERTGDLTQARQHYLAARAADPKLAAADVNLGLMAEKADDLEKARQHYRTALERDPKHADAHNNMGVVSAKLGDLRSAERHLEQAVALHPGFAEAHNNLGIFYETAGRAGEAKRAYEAALRADPSYQEARRNLALLMRRLRRP